MGTGASSIHHPKNQAKLLFISSNGSSSSTTVKVIHSTYGSLQEFRHPTTAANVLSVYQPDTVFLCSVENMFVNCHVPHVPADEELQPDQIYFVMPISMSHRPISLKELCLLAIKTSSALQKSSGSEMKETTRTTSYSGRRKSNIGNARKNQKVDFQVALKKL